MKAHTNCEDLRSKFTLKEYKVLRAEIDRKIHYYWIRAILHLGFNLEDRSEYIKMDLVDTCAYHIPFIASGICLVEANATFVYIHKTN